MAVNTRLAYKTACRKYQEFRRDYSLPLLWPSPVAHLVLFISYCFEAGLAASTIRLYTSGICFVHKIHGWSDPSEGFIIQKLLEGYRRTRQRKDGRVPITISILTKICQHLPFVTYSRYETLLFRAVYSLAYFGLFRVSELVVTRPTEIDLNHALRIKDVHFEKSTEAIVIRIRSSKTSQRGPSVSIRIPNSVSDGISCVQFMYMSDHTKETSFSVMLMENHLPGPNFLEFSLKFLNTLASFLMPTVHTVSELAGLVS